MAVLHRILLHVSQTVVKDPYTFYDTCIRQSYFDNGDILKHAGLQP